MRKRPGDAFAEMDVFRRTSSTSASHVEISTKPGVHMRHPAYRSGTNAMLVMWHGCDSLV